jgi:hypothetical protein
MRVLVCGGRDFGNLPPHHVRDKPEFKAIWEAKKAEYLLMIAFLEKFSIENSIHYNPNDNWLPSDIEIISGMAKGADSAAVDWAVVNWCKVHEFPADWKKYGRAAGAIRNQQMLDEGKPDVVIAFPGGRGTAHMVKIAKAKGVKTIVVDRSGCICP